LVAPQFLPVPPQLDRDAGFTESLVFDLSRNRRNLLTVSDEVSVVGRAERAQRGQKTRGFEQIRFTLAVGAEQKLLTTLELERSETHVAKMPKRKFAQAHGSHKVRRGTPRNENQISRDCRIAASGSFEPIIFGG
jgi:hypothetical protein